MSGPLVSARFRTCVDRLIVIEGNGKVANSPNDRGGLTRWGISQRSYPHLDIRNLTRDDAVQIYHRDFWTPIRGDKFDSIAVANVVFVYGVHSGPGTSAKRLQETLNGLGKPLSVDGRIGPATLSAANSVPPLVLVDAFKRNIQAHYDRIIAADPTQEGFANGWRNRLKGGL